MDQLRDPKRSLTFWSVPKDKAKDAVWASFSILGLLVDITFIFDWVMLQ